MKPVFVNNNLSTANTPLEVAAACIAACDALRVEKLLWEVYALASIGGLGGRAVLDSCVLSAEEVASLFDQLIALLKALESLQEQGGARLLCMEGGRTNV